MFTTPIAKNGACGIAWRFSTVSSLRLFQCKLECVLQCSSWPERSGSGTVCNWLDCFVIDGSLFFSCEINVIWMQIGRCVIFSFFSCDVAIPKLSNVSPSFVLGASLEAKLS